LLAETSQLAAKVGSLHRDQLQDPHKQTPIDAMATKRSSEVNLERIMFWPFQCFEKQM
jgi:hypothetical protein